MSVLFRPRLLLVAAAFLVAALGVLSLSKNASLSDLPTVNRLWFLENLMPSLKSGASSSMDPIPLQLRNSAEQITNLEIPRAYISKVSQPHQTLQSFVTLAIYLPDYLPRFLADKAGHDTQGADANGVDLPSKDELAVEIRATIPSAALQELEWIRNHSVSGGLYRDRFEIYYERQHKAGSGAAEPNLNSGYFIPIRSADNIIFFASPRTGELVGCTLRFDLTDRVAVKVTFSAAHLMQFEEIKAGVSKVLREFVRSPS